MKLNEIKNVPGQQLNEERQYHLTDGTVKEVAAHIITGMKEVAEKFKAEEAHADSVPAGPDTSKFRAIRSGMIQYEQSVHVSGGQYGTPTTYAHFIKIGRNVPTKVVQRIKTALIDVCDEIITIEGFEIPGAIHCEDGIIVFAEEDGTNWGGIGFYARKYSDFEKKLYDEKLDKQKIDHAHTGD